MVNPLKWWINRKLPEADNRAGIGPFRLGEDYDWMHRAWVLHDHDYSESDYRVTPDTPVPKLRRSESDWNSFWRLVMLARAEPDPIKRCRKAHQICEIWPIARRGGLYFWGPENPPKP